MEEKFYTLAKNANSKIDLLLVGKKKDLGGFEIHRLLPSEYCKSVGPWVFFDHIGPAKFPAGQGINVRPHPHINLATVTCLFDAEIFHRDSLGNAQAITPGAINLMVAGKGIVHSERERPEIHNQSHTLHGLQLWLALPTQDEEIDPSFHHYAAEVIPKTTIDGVHIRVMMGEFAGITSPVKTFAQTVYLEATLQPGQTITMPQVPERAVYVCSGQLESETTDIVEHAMAVFKCDRQIILTASKPSRIVIIGGEHLGERYIEWNFVSSSQARIEQAKHDWVNGLFATIPGDDQEYIPLPR